MPEGELAQFLADRDAWCPECRYNLRGLAGSNCPECGRQISPTTVLLWYPRVSATCHSVGACGLLGAILIAVPVCMPLAVGVSGLTHPVVAVFGVLTAWIPLILLFAVWQRDHARFERFSQPVRVLLAAGCWLWVPAVPLIFFAL